MKRIRERHELVELARKLGVRPDWHEPDEQAVTVEVDGVSFDNAGFWPRSEFPDSNPIIIEHHVVVKQDGKAVAVVNLATLFAWATGLDR